MHLYLLRHANADTDAPTDDERQLSEKGIEQARRVGRFARRIGIEPDLILTSPLARARQTAEYFSQEHRGTKPEIAGFLASGMQPETAMAELRAYLKFESIMIVGHEPDFSRLIAQFIGLTDNENVLIRKASLTLLDVAACRPGAAILEFTVPCRLM